MDRRACLQVLMLGAQGVGVGKRLEGWWHSAPMARGMWEGKL